MESLKDIPLPLIVCVVGFVMWWAFSPPRRRADAWWAKVGEWAYFAGLLATLFKL